LSFHKKSSLTRRVKMGTVQGHYSEIHCPRPHAQSFVWLIPCIS
jgi:hypothetical protein